MNALLSRPVLNAVSFFIGTSPDSAGSENLPGPLALYRPIGVDVTGDRRGRWTYPESLEHAPQLPQFVTGAGRRAFLAYWS